MESSLSISWPRRSIIEDGVHMTLSASCSSVILVRIGYILGHPQPTFAARAVGKNGGGGGGGGDGDGGGRGISLNLISSIKVTLVRIQAAID